MLLPHPSTVTPVIKPSPLSGFRVLIGGTIGFVVLLLILDPVTRQEDCQNYHAAGNASVFDDERWDLFFLAAPVFWILLIIVEQLLPWTWRGRSGWEITARGLGAVLIAMLLSCALFLRLLGLCH
ncbi:hypothetical protein Alo02nite_76650 [Actinoplanes lobatus]|uniref:Uncharacterized protein n=1 Tax=Actinoplanes lobatus TaxID=113568 RepID=A0ABQ4AUW8_9ACTN|nr:hypothetical protein Alo02nite_76650 [Actinoplanes lobatus]